MSDESEPSEDENSASGEEGWRTAEGERLADFGVDEDVEFYDYEGDYQAEDADEDDIPLALLKTSLVARRSRSSNDSASVSARDSHR